MSCVDMSGFMRQLNHLDREGIKQASSEAIRKSILLVERDAVDGCPVDTGYLRLKMKQEQISEWEGKVSNNAEYASYVNYGTSFMAPQPFLTDALYSNRREIAEIFKRELERRVILCR